MLTWIEDYLGEGSERAKKREQLCMETGLNDRLVRALIAEARDRGVLICNDGDGNGYYISNNTSDIQRQYREDMSRIAAISRRAKHFRKALKERGAL